MKSKPKLIAAKYFLLTMMLLSQSLLLFAQTNQTTVKGTVTDARNKQPLAGATVKLEKY